MAKWKAGQGICVERLFWCTSLTALMVSYASSRNNWLACFVTRAITSCAFVCCGNCCMCICVFKRSGLVKESSVVHSVSCILYQVCWLWNDGCYFWLFWVTSCPLWWLKLTAIVCWYSSHSDLFPGCCRCMSKDHSHGLFWCAQQYNTVFQICD